MSKMESVGENNLKITKQDPFLSGIKITWFQQLIINILKQGLLPKHVAFIMDGNRRYASDHHLSMEEGYLKGYEILIEIHDILLEMGIKEITVYAFSIENFKRNPKEVTFLLNLLLEKCYVFQRSCHDKNSRGTQFRFIGNRNLLPKNLQNIMAQIELETMKFNKIIFTCAVAYTSRDDITNSIRTILKGVEEKKIKLIDIDEYLIEKCLSTSVSLEPDIIIRTSGESRFSDFLLWENTTTMFITICNNWPDIKFWHVIKMIINYQIYSGCVKKFRDYLYHYRKKDVSEDIKKRQMDFVKSVQEERYQEIVKMGQYK